MSAVSTCWGWFLGIAFAFSGNCALAQITPDGTLPNNSNVRLQGNTFNITGGTQAGSNLFHSFGQFSVPTGGTAFFNNAVDIQNIISRVTGGSVSSIDGVIKASGTANLFFLNPNGIVFGRNASLNVGGSFIATTASGFKFPDGSEFNATNSQGSPLLTVSLTPGLQYRGTPGAIYVQGATLSVAPGQALMLLGGDVRVESATLEAPGGRIELGGLAGAGIVEFTPESSLLSSRFPGGGAPRANVSVIDSLVNVTAVNGGTIAVNADKFEVLGVNNDAASDNNGLEAGIKSGLGTSSSQSGDITVDATKVVVSRAIISNEVEDGAIGQGGNINITTGTLAITKGGQIITALFGRGNAGNTNIKARDTVSADDIDSPIGITGIFSGVFLNGAGKGGNTNISTGSLELNNGAQIASAVFGRGDAGKINIQARDTVSLDGVNNKFRGNSSEINSRVRSGVEGNAGNIIITTGLLRLSNGASIDSSTGSRNAGSAGDVKINANTFEALSGGQVRSTTFSNGRAGDITFNVSDQITLSGSDSTYMARLAKFGSTAVGRRQVVNQGPESGIFANAAAGSSGQVGSIRIATGQLTVQDSARVNVGNQGTGNAGNLKIQARSIRLDTKGKLTAQTTSGRGGNISIKDADLLLLRRNSQISTNADTSQLGADVAGGNINIDSKLIVALPEENSDITANAFAGSGGRVDITGQGIFGIEPRDRQTDLSDITASSQSGVQGTIQINTPNVDPNRGLLKLPTGLVNTPALVASSCGAFGKGGSEFTVTGRGGLPLSPDDFLSPDVVWTDTRLGATT
ncbi:MAG: filamentous hemagglutinin N-terminal domain-containing protein, partial [Hassallia sp.]